VLAQRLERLEHAFARKLAALHQAAIGDAWMGVDELGLAAGSCRQDAQQAPARVENHQREILKALSVIAQESSAVQKRAVQRIGDECVPRLGVSWLEGFDPKPVLRQDAP